jgi:isorenieratene synthase
MLQNNFTALAPGVDAHRPPPETDLTNLFAAGDWVRLPIPAFLMEAAVASGKLVANLVFEREGLKTNEIPHVDHAGPLA